jgi:hypothetical protein
VAELARNAPHRQEYMLRDVVARGVAFHHAGLTADERELVERAYWSGGAHDMHVHSAIGTCCVFPDACGRTYRRVASCIRY